MCCLFNCQWFCYLLCLFVLMSKPKNICTLNFSCLFFFLFFLHFKLQRANLACAGNKTITASDIWLQHYLQFFKRGNSLLFVFGHWALIIPRMMPDKCGSQMWTYFIQATGVQQREINVLVGWNSWELMQG